MGATQDDLWRARAVSAEDPSSFPLGAGPQGVWFRKFRLNHDWTVTRHFAYDASSEQGRAGVPLVVHFHGFDAHRNELLERMSEKY